MLSAIQNYLLKTGFQRFEPKLALFDMDGVLYDSMPNHAIAWHKSMASCGLAMTEKDAYAYEGMRGVEVIRMMARQQWGREISIEEAEEMYRNKSELYAKSPTATIIPGVLQLQEAMKARSITIGVVTGSGQTTLINRLLRDFDGLLSSNVIVTAKDVTHGKPAPDPYLQGMRKAGCEPWQTIVVENAPLGVQAGVAARCFTVAVNTGPLEDDALKEAGADMVFKAMDELRECLTDTMTTLSNTNH